MVATENLVFYIDVTGSVCIKRTSDER